MRGLSKYSGCLLFAPIFVSLSLPLRSLSLALSFGPWTLDFGRLHACAWCLNLHVTRVDLANCHNEVDFSERSLILKLFFLGSPGVHGIALHV
jgi:hypothetical protein